MDPRGTRSRGSGRALTLLRPLSFLLALIATQGIACPVVLQGPLSTSVRLVDFLTFNLLASVTSCRAVRVDLTLDPESLVNSASLSVCYVPSVVLRARGNCGK
ncbi:hypothetical protein E5288_WYG010959 [Bos mutus]|uniref:Uncharacterized protein n=1 Tax=Bos mutus TaxID=72004 RepID=A0A6B0QXW2_9CETA|nr:hypothetical protein [Bos mutus]